MISRNEFLKMGMALPLALQSLGQRGGGESQDASTPDYFHQQLPRVL